MTYQNFLGLFAAQERAGWLATVKWAFITNSFPGEWPKNVPSLCANTHAPDFLISSWQDSDLSFRFSFHARTNCGFLWSLYLIVFNFEQRRDMKGHRHFLRKHQIPWIKFNTMYHFFSDCFMFTISQQCNWLKNSWDMRYGTFSVG